MNDQRSLMEKVLERVILKVTSARWVIAIIVASTFAYLACAGKMPADDVKVFIGIVLTFYFTKSRISSSSKITSNDTENPKK